MTSQTDQPSSPRHWIVSPWFDFFFVINLWWLLAFLPQSETANLNQATSIEFWQIYFLTAPHRWITLVLVASDPDRREGREGWFIGLAVIAGLIVAGVWFGFKNLTCLVLADFIWNAWHFASQHGGVLRIYGRMGGGGRPVMERWGFRVFVTYTALRTAGSLIGFTENYPLAGTIMNFMDYGVLALPVLLVGFELIDRGEEPTGEFG